MKFRWRKNSETQGEYVISKCLLLFEASFAKVSTYLINGTFLKTTTYLDLNSLSVSSDLPTR
jgi:hypothetical protein